MDATSPSEPLALPASESDTVDNTKKLHIDQTIKLDDLGPIVVNTDGTLSRIANWKGLTEKEQERTMRVLGARNKLRMANEEKKQLQGSAPSGKEEPSSSSQGL